MAVKAKTTSAVLWLALLIVGLGGLLPFLWIVLGSLKPDSEVQSGRLWPWQEYQTVEAPATGGAEPVKVTERVTGENYRKILKGLTNLPTYYFNTFYLAVAGTFLSLLLGTLAAYGFSQFGFAGNKWLFGLMLLTIMIPAEVTLMGRYELMFHLRLFDKIVGLLIAYAAGNLLLVIFIMRNVFNSVPRDLSDAAVIDGASPWKVFWDVFVPIGKNGIAACAVLTFLNIWNEFLFALTFTSQERVRTLPVGITLLKGQFGRMESGVLFATVLLSFLPIVLIFVLLQKQFVRGLSSGALKG